MTSSVNFSLFYDELDRTIRNNNNYVHLEAVVSDNDLIKEVYIQFVREAVNRFGPKGQQKNSRIHKFASRIESLHNMSTKYFACLLPDYRVLPLSAEMHVSKYQELIRDSNAKHAFLICGEHVIRDMTQSEPVYKTLENTKEENERLRLALEDEKTKTAQKADEMSRMIDLVKQRESQLQSTLEKLGGYKAFVETLKESVSEKLDQLLQEVQDAKSDAGGSKIRNLFKRNRDTNCRYSLQPEMCASCERPVPYAQE